MGHMDAEGWFCIVDRKKVQTNAGGYKVWPREVEDCSTNTKRCGRHPWPACPPSTAAEL